MRLAQVLKYREDKNNFIVYLVVTYRVQFIIKSKEKLTFTDIVQLNLIK